jgi:primosomal replication protein N
VTVELDCVAIGEQAQKLEQISPGMELELSGFLARRSKKSRWMVFHINESELK